MIEEKIIDEYINSINKGVENHLSHATQLVAYLNSENFSTFNAKENEILFFCFEVIFNSYYLAHNKIVEIDIEDLFEKEEVNWKSLDEAKNFDEAKDHWFNAYPEIDLLAFVEDMLAEENENELSKIAREIIFVTSKSFIDLICNL